MVESCHAIIVELRGDGAEYGHFLGGPFPQIPVSLDLFADISDSIFPTPFFKLVDHDQVRIIEHVNFFKLGRSTKFAGHNVYGNVRQVDDARIPLPDTGSFRNDQIKTCGLGHMDDIGQRFRDFRQGLTGCE